MKKIVIHRPGDYTKLKIEDFPSPTPKSKEVLIKVRAIGVNYADVLIRWGVYSSAKEYVGWPITPGFEVSGTVISVGSEVSKFKTGDSVVGVTRFGGYATEVCLEEDFIFNLPKTLSFEEGAAFPAVYLTAYHALFQNIVIRKNSKVLIHSCAGGVGSALLELCRLNHYQTTGIVGSSHKVQYAKSLGADHVIDKSSSDLWTEAEKISPEGFDVILDANGASTLKDSYKHLAPTGKLICYGFHSMFSRTGGKLNYLKLIKTYFQTPRFNPLDMTSANKSLITFNLSYLFDKKETFLEAMNHLSILFENGDLKAPKITSFSFDDVALAHKALESGMTTGKLILTC